MLAIPDAIAKAMANPATIDALASAIVQIVAAISRPESIAALALTVLIVVLVQKPQK